MNINSRFCDELTEIMPNTEKVTFTTNPDFTPEQTSPVAIPLENKATGIIITILCLPACAFLFMIFKNKKIFATEKTKSKEVIDY